MLPTMPLNQKAKHFEFVTTLCLYITCATDNTSKGKLENTNVQCDVLQILYSGSVAPNRVRSSKLYLRESKWQPSSNSKPFTTYLLALREGVREADSCAAVSSGGRGLLLGF